MTGPVPTCGHDDDWMYLHSRCHMGDPAYVRVNGNLLVVECAQCDKEIASFKISSLESDK